MKLLSLIAIFLTCAFTSSYAQKTDWNAGGGTWVDDFVNGVTTDKKGNVYSTGKVGSWGTVFDVSFQGWGYYLLKQNRSGTIKWVKYNTGDSYDAAGEDVAVDSKGNVYVVGSFHYDMNFGDTTIQGGASGILSTMFFVKYDSMGNKKWLRAIGDPGHVGIGQLAIDKDDNLYLAGSYWDHLNLGNIGINTEHPYYFPSSDIFVSRWTTDGKPVWIRSLSTSDDNTTSALQTDPNGNVHIVGTYKNTDFASGSTKYKFKDSYGTFLASCDPAGKLLKVIETEQYVGDMDINKNGDLYLTGTMSYNTSTICHVSKLKPDYSTDWVKGITTNAYAQPTIAVDDGNVYMSSRHSGSMAIDSLTIASQSGIFVTKISDIGAVQWTKHFSSTGGADGVRALATGTAKSVNFAGYYTESVLNFDDHTINNNSGNDDGDIFIAQLRDTTATKCPAKTSKLSIAHNRICKGDSIQLTTNFGPSSYSVQWYLNDNPVAVGPTFYAKTTGNYKYVRYPGSSCADMSNVIRLDVFDYPSKNISQPVVTCDPAATISVTANDAYSYKWYKDKKLLPDESSASLAASAGTGTYYCYLTVEGASCTTKSDETTVQLYNKPVFEITSTAVTPGRVKYGISNTQDVKSYSWSITGTQVSSVAANPVLTFSALGANEVCVTAANPGCDVKKCTDVVITCPPRSALLTADPTKFCAGDSTQLKTNLDVNSTEVVDWYLNKTLVASKNKFYAKAAGDFKFVRYAGVCSDTSNAVTIQVSNGPDFSIKVTPVLWNKMQYQVSDPANITSYAWTVKDKSNANSVQTSTDASPTFTFASAEGSFQVCVTASNGCKTTKCVDQVITGFEDLIEGVQIFPNPFTETLQIVGGNGALSATVFDSGGRLIESGSSTGTFELKTSRWAAGVYLVIVNIDGRVRTLKVVKD